MSWSGARIDPLRVVVAPGAIAFGETYPQPREMSGGEIDALVQAYVDAVERCKLIGCTSPLAFSFLRKLIRATGS